MSQNTRFQVSLIAIAGMVVLCQGVRAGDVVQVHRMSAGSIPAGGEHVVSWEAADWDEPGSSWSPSSPAEIVVPPGAVRARCHAHLEFTEAGPLPLSYVVLRMTVNNGHIGRSLPEALGLRFPSGLWAADSVTPWFRVAPGKRLAVTAEVAGSAPPWVTAESFWECEFHRPGLFADDFESGNAGRWGGGR